MLILLITTEHEAPTDLQTKKCPQSKPDRTRRKQLEKTTYRVPCISPSKYKPPRGLYLEIALKYKVKQSKNGKFTSNYKV